MSRGIGEFGPIQEFIPEWAAILVALLTQLGDVWFLVLVLVTLYWFHGDEREAVATVAGLTFAGMGLYRGLKHLFGFPRPDEPLVHVELLPWYVQPLYEATALADGYGFPSGHAVNTTIVYFGLAAALTTGRRRLRYVVAASLVTIVAFSRVALGVHYLVDVVVGVALGLAFLGATRELFGRYPVDRPTIAFALAIGLAGFYAGMSDVDTDSVLLFGVALGAFAGWQLVMLGRSLSVLERPSAAVRPLAIRGGLAVAGFVALFAAIERFELLSAYAGASAVGFATATILVIPVARRSRRVDMAWSSLVFWVTMAGLGLRFLLRPSTWRRAASAVGVYARVVYRRVRSRESD